MATLKTKIDTASVEFQTNYAYMLETVNDFKSKIKSFHEGGSKKARDKHLANSKLLPRERLTTLLDNKDSFLEFSEFAGFEVYQDNIPCAGIISGIGTIANQECVIIINDPTVKGGTYFPLTVKKHLRAQTIALENNLPCIYLVDSGGAFLPKQDEVFPDKEHFGRIFFNQAQMSAQGVPQIAVVLGSCTAGGAYIPAMADQTIMVKKQSSIFLGGPPLVKAATGEIVSIEELGGADVHCRYSGVADYYTDNDLDALSKTKEIVKNLNRKKLVSIKMSPSKEPQVSPEDLYGIIPKDPRKSFDSREIIMRIIDNSEFEEFKELYGKTLVCGFAHINGFTVGIIANNGILFSESAEKGTHFIQLCCQRKIPLVFLQNITGFMVGKKYEEQGIAKQGAKMVNAVSCANVPKFTIIVGGSFGAGNYAMCGRAFGARFLWMWPNARISVMGGEQAANVLAQITKEQKSRLGQKWSQTEEDKIKKPILEQYSKQSSSYYASARLWDDGIIDPMQTRKVLSIALSASTNKEMSESKFGVFRM